VIALGRSQPAQNKKNEETNSIGMIVQEAANSSIDVKEHIDALLETVFHIFCRISLSRESDEDFLPLGKYQ